MRKVFAVALMTAMVGAVGFTQSAGAGVTYDFVFRSTDINGNPIGGGEVTGGGKSFGFYSSPGSLGVALVLDVLLRTTDPLFVASVSIVFDDSSGLTVAVAQEWLGQGILFNMMGAPVDRFAPLGGLTCVGNTCGSFVRPRCSPS